MVSKRIASKINLSYAFLFASGALLTTAIVHIIPEAMEELEAEHPDNIYENGLKAGIAVMAGLFAGFLLHVAFANAHSHVHELAHAKLTAAVGDDAIAAAAASHETEHFVTSTGTSTAAASSAPPAGPYGHGGGGAIKAGSIPKSVSGGGGGGISALERERTRVRTTGASLSRRWR